jgi:hypothetical protein
MNVLILGLPKSGTSWLHRSVAEAFPKHAVSMERLPYATPEQFENGLIAKEVFNRAAGLVRFNETVKKFHKIIYIVRDPRDRLVSAMMYAPFNLVTGFDSSFVTDFPALIEKKQAHTDAVSCHEICTALGGKDYFIPTMGKEQDLTLGMHWATSHGVPVLIVRYEDLIAGGHAKVSDFLGVTVGKEPKADDVLKRVGRTKRYGDWKQWFTPSDVELFKPIAEGNIKTFGYDNDWTLPETQVIKPEEGSEFVRTMIRKRIGVQAAVNKRQEGKSEH